MTAEQNANGSGVTDIVLSELDGAPCARDIDIAKRLGFAKGGERQIRRLIERNRAELETYGPLACQRDTSISGKGREVEVNEFWLNEEQALTVAAISKAPKAPAVRGMLIRVFVAWRRGHLGQRNDALEARLSEQAAHLERLESMLTAMVITHDQRRAALAYASVRVLLEEAKALPKGRNSLNRKIGRALAGRALFATSQGEPAPCLKDANTGTWLWKRDFADRYMREVGNGLVSLHNDKVTGQGVIRFPDRRVKAEVRT